MGSGHGEKVASNHQGKVVGRKPGKWNLGALTGTDGCLQKGQFPGMHRAEFPEGAGTHCYPLPHLPLSVATRQMSWGTSRKPHPVL